MQVSASDEELPTLIELHTFIHTAAPLSSQNPCLMALRLAGSCESAARRFVNDRLRVARLREAELIFEFVASGLLHVAARDAVHAEAAKGYNLTQSRSHSISFSIDLDLTQSRSHSISMMIALWLPLDDP